MRIRVDFTIDVPAERLPALRELALAENNAQAALFVKSEAQDLITGYLSDMGVNTTVTRDAATTY